MASQITLPLLFFGAPPVVWLSRLNICATFQAEAFASPGLPTLAQAMSWCDRVWELLPAMFTTTLSQHFSGEAAKYYGRRSTWLQARLHNNEQHALALSVFLGPSKQNRR
jgi:hypothetical protein